MQLLPKPVRLAAGIVAGLAAGLAGAGIAHASDRWEEAGSGAVAILPVPLKASAVYGGSLACAEQHWTLRLRTEARPDATGSVAVEVAVDGRKTMLDASQSPTLVDIPVDRDTLDRLKRGVSLAVRIGSEKGAPSAAFSLRNSQKAIDAVAPRCSPVNMAGYDHVALVESPADGETVENLLSEEIKLFRQATASAPRIASARIAGGGGRELLFASLCGSSWYYGRSGCTLFGFARTSPSAEWREVYHSEGMGLYVKHQAMPDGWPELATLQVGDTEPMRWRWDGSRYELRSSEFVADELKGSIVTP